MNRNSPLLWFGIALILLLPSAAGRFLLDIAGGLLFLFLLIPVILTSIGWIGWKILQSKMNSCPTCGTAFINDLTQCPICHTKINNDINSSIPASSATIDITAEDY